MKITRNIFSDNSGLFRARKWTKKRVKQAFFGTISDYISLFQSVEQPKVRNNLQKCFRSLEVEHGAMSTLLFMKLGKCVYNMWFYNNRYSRFSEFRPFM